MCGWQVKLCDPIVTHGPYLSPSEIKGLLIKLSINSSVYFTLRWPYLCIVVFFGLLLCVPSVRWHCWLGHLTRKNPSPIWPIMCWWDVKPYSINQSIIMELTLGYPTFKLKLWASCSLNRYAAGKVIVKVKKGIAVCRQACHHRYGNSHTIWDHTVLPATRQRWHSRLYPSQSWYSI